MLWQAKWQNKMHLGFFCYFVSQILTFKKAYVFTDCFGGHVHIVITFYFCFSKMRIILNVYFSYGFSDTFKVRII